MTSEIKRQSKWKEDWLHQKDSAGDRFSEYFVKTDDEYNAKCLWCKKEIYFGSAGKAALAQHAKSKGHLFVADARKQRRADQVLLVATENNNNPGPGGLGEEGGGVAGKSQTTRTFGLQKLAAPPSLPNSSRLGLVDQVTAAEALLVMKAAESDWSYASMETLPAVCAKADSKSAVWPKIKLGRDKHSYMITHGLLPHFHNMIVKDLRLSHGFVMIIYAATFKQQGLSQHCEIKVIFWSEKYGEVQDAFLDFNTVGHETAAIQVENIKKSLEKDGLTLANVLQLSRDNPNVMKSVFTKLKIEAAAAGNPNLFDAPCYIHPTHTAFRKAVTSLETDLSDILTDLFGFFKHTTARR